MKKFLYIPLIFFQTMLFAQLPFKPISHVTKEHELIIPEKLTYQILFAEGDTVTADNNRKAPAKGMHDYNCYIPSKENPKKGMLYVSHESNDSSTILGDGGGATILSLEYKNNKWEVLAKENVDFKSVGGTLKNCSGVLTNTGNVLTAEEFPPNSNKELYDKGRGTRDTANVGKLAKWQTYGWMVEVDPKTKKAIRKLYGMGRYSHEGLVIMPDNKTVYLSDDYAPSVLFKFVAATANDFTKGQLYAYKQAPNKFTGSWIALPMDMDSLVDARDVALRLGATFFLRVEWMTLVDGKVYFTETGVDYMQVTSQNCYKGIAAKHLGKLTKVTDNEKTIECPNGNLMVLDPKTDEIKPLVEGGTGIKDPNKFFANPDGITNCNINGKKYLVINEDIIEGNRAQKNSYNSYNNEVWWLDLSIKNPTVDDLHRFLIAPAGAETTGGYFSPDQKHYFLNVQHPNTSNKEPWNKSTTIVISGW